MEQFHGRPVPVDEDEDVPLAHVVSHLIPHHAAKGVHSLAHVGLARAKEVAHGVIQAEHGRKGFDRSG